MDSSQPRILINYFISAGYGTRSPVWIKGKGMFLTVRFAYDFDGWTHPSNWTYVAEANPYDPNFKGKFAELDDVEFEDFTIIYKAVQEKLRQLRDEHNQMKGNAERAKRL